MEHALVTWPVGKNAITYNKDNIMSERLDRIGSLLLSTAERLDTTAERLDETNVTLNQTNVTLNQTNATLDRTNATLDQVAAQQRQNTINIDNLLAAISTTDVEVRNLRESVLANEERFNILIQEMRADRRASQQAFQALLLQLANVNGRVDDLEAAN